MTVNKIIQCLLFHYFIIRICSHSGTSTTTDHLLTSLFLVHAPKSGVDSNFDGVMTKNESRMEFDID